MAVTRSERQITQYSSLGNIKLKGGLFRKSRDPSVDLHHEITSFLNTQKARFNESVSNTFDIETETPSKYEFFYINPRATRITDVEQKISKAQVAFRSEASATILYLKPRSLIIFQTEFKFAITEPGCGGSGAVMYPGGKDYELEEIYFNKITNVGSHHSEVQTEVLEEGCGAGKGVIFNHEKDGFIIRAGENWTIIADEHNTSELKDARSQINAKISETN